MKTLFVTALFVLLIAFTNSSFAVSSDSTLSSAIVFTASLNAAQESSSDTSKGTGTAYAVLSADRKQLTYRITYAQLTSNFSAAHFHLGASGVNGGVVKPITTFNGNSAMGVWSDIPDSLVGELLKGNIYINIHTANYKAGEIRGQLTPVEGAGFYMNIDAAQVTYADTSMATGTGWAVLTDSASVPSLKYSITFAGLTSQFTDAHFHLGAPGVSGGVIHPITADFHDSTATGVWSNINNADLLNLLKGDLYVNIHSKDYAAGEIRGQIKLMKPLAFYAYLDGSQETPPVTTDASGTAWLILNMDSASLGYHITYANLQGKFTDAHFHLGAVGIGGGVVDPITSSFTGNTGSGIWSNMPDSLIIEVVKGDLYMNVHSSAHIAGEIRGQVMLIKGIAFNASLDGNQDVPPIMTNGTGTASLSFSNDTLKYQITVAKLSSTLTHAHFHLASAGANGGVVEPINYTDSTTNSFWTNINDTTLAHLAKGDIYINIHSSNFPAGEIRGQVLTFDNPGTVTAVIPNTTSTLPTGFNLSQNYPNPFNPTTVIEYSLPRSGIVTLKVYDILGREVATLVNAKKAAGNYQVEFNGSKLASGVYIYRLQTGNFSAVKKLVLLK